MDERLTKRPSFQEQLQHKWAEGKFLCVGLDPDLDKLPQAFHEFEVSDPKQGSSSRFQIADSFLIPIIDATADIVCAYKPNLAFFEFFDHGHTVLSRVVNYIHEKYPDIPVIGDGKRADIGNTNKGYAKMAFDPSLGGYNFDAMTTNPYPGHKTYQPFLDHSGKGLIAVCKTSNPDAFIYQDLPINLERAVKTNKISGEEYDDIRARLKDEEINLQDFCVYQLVAYLHGRLADQNPNIGIVVGATHPEAFIPVRRLYGEGLILIPGVGTQGGDLEKTVKCASNQQREGYIISSSSAILFASSGSDFAAAARAKAIETDQQIRELRKTA